MEKGFSLENPALIDYAYRTFRPEDDMLLSIKEESRKRGLPEIEVGAFDNLHLEILVRLANAHNVVEIGTLGGYSGISICRGLMPGGILHTFEENPHHAEVARLNFARAGYADRVRIHVGPAMENLNQIEREGPFDLVFIDADKKCYPEYLEWATHALRLGGVVVADNTFAFGKIDNHEYRDEEERKAVEAIRKFNRQVSEGGRFRATILPTAEGMTVAVKIR